MMYRWQYGALLLQFILSIRWVECLVPLLFVLLVNRHPQLIHRFIQECPEPLQAHKRLNVKFRRAVLSLSNSFELYFTTDLVNTSGV